MRPDYNFEKFSALNHRERTMWLLADDEQAFAMLRTITDMADHGDRQAFRTLLRISLATQAADKDSSVTVAEIQSAWAAEGLHPTVLAPPPGFSLIGPADEAPPSYHELRPNLTKDRMRVFEWDWMDAKEIVVNNGDLIAKWEAK